MILSKNILARRSIHPNNATVSDHLSITSQTLIDASGIINIGSGHDPKVKSFRSNLQRVGPNQRSGSTKEKGCTFSPEKQLLVI